MVAERIKYLREQKGLTQADLAKQLGITRSSVNAWEMGISVPSTQYIVELSNIFKVSTDYLLGVERSASISVAGLTEKDVQYVQGLIAHLEEKNKNRDEHGDGAPCTIPCFLFCHSPCTWLCQGKDKTAAA